MIDIKQEHLLPLPIRIFGFALMIIGTVLTGIFLYEWIALNRFSWILPGGMIMAVAGGLLSLTHYRLMIFPDRKVYTICVWLLGYRQGREEPFRYVDHIYINRVIESTTMSSFTGHPNEVREYLFKAFMKLDNGEKIHLDTDKAEHLLRSRVQIYIRQLGELYRGMEID